VHISCRPPFLPPARLSGTCSLRLSSETGSNCTWSPHTRCTKNVSRYGPNPTQVGIPSRFRLARSALGSLPQSARNDRALQLEPPYFFQRQNICSPMPVFRTISATAVRDSCCRRANVTCRVPFLYGPNPPSEGARISRILTFYPDQESGAGQELLASSREGCRRSNTQLAGSGQLLNLRCTSLAAQGGVEPTGW